VSVAAFRLVKEQHAPTAFDGIGAERFGGRWNSPGVRVVYTSESRALAVLEVLVHIDRTIPFRWVLCGCRIPADLVETLSRDDLPKDWDSSPAPRSAQAVGTSWASPGRRPVLRVPSAVVPDEFNLLLNPQHPHFSRITMLAPVPFSFDPRLITSSDKR